MDEKEWKKIDGTLWIAFKDPYPEYPYTSTPYFGRVSDKLIEMPTKRTSELWYRITENFLELRLKGKVEEEENVEEENLIFINQAHIHTFQINKIIIKSE